MRKERIMEEADEELEFSEQGGNPSGEAWQDAGRNQAQVVKRTTASLREMGDTKERSQPKGAGRELGCGRAELEGVEGSRMRCPACG